MLEELCCDIVRDKTFCSNVWFPGSKERASRVGGGVSEGKGAYICVSTEELLLCKEGGIGLDWGRVGDSRRRRCAGPPVEAWWMDGEG